MSLFNKLKNMFADPYEEDVIYEAPADETLNLEEATTEEILEEATDEEILEEEILEIEESDDDNEGYEVSDEQVSYINSLTPTSQGFSKKIKNLMQISHIPDEDFFEELEEIMIGSDISVKTTLRLTDEVRKYAQQTKNITAEDLKPIIVELMGKMFGNEKHIVDVDSANPFIIFVSGVNGAGKTTSIGKMTHIYKQQGKKILLVPADTFRAGAINQLIEWAKRNDVDYIDAKEGQDPAAVVFDAMRTLENGDYDLCIIDTSGRLQNKVNLMKELEKMYGIVEKAYPNAPHESLLAIDANTGNNGILQAKEFAKITNLTGIILTKLDGTARGGIAFSIKEELNIPIKYIGLGEGIEDLKPFEVEEYLIGIFKDII